MLLGKEESGMIKKGFKGRCQKRQMKKCKDVVRTYGTIQLAYAEVLEKEEDITEFQCNVMQMMDRLVEQMKEKQGVTEELKMQNQMAWVGRMNNIRACAEEIVLEEIVYR